ncbi:MAG TPA: MgtC/SapB family protein [Steroidobacteraceae bacterium]|nr:MgtC/SapB family protein [Steroidobacteraceae bacterium]
MPDLNLTLVWNFATALLIGALIGIERERHGREHDMPGIAGMRTFMLYALFGALCGWLSIAFKVPWVLAAGLLAASAALLAGYVLSVRMDAENIGQTTEVAALATFLLGAVAAHGERELAAGLGVAVAAILAYKQPLHGFVEKLGPDDVYAALRLLVATFIILPILPDEPLDPWGALNPQSLWLLVLLISGLSLVGYVLTRMLGAHRGIPITGLAGGLASSTAVTLSLARQSREPQYEQAGAAIVAGVLLAWTVSFARVFVEVLVVNRALLPVVLPALIAMSAVCAGFAWLMLRRAGRDGGEAQEVPLRNPFSLTSAIKFAAIFALVLLVVKVVQDQAPEAGMYVVAAIAGTTDVDAMTLSMAQYALTNSPQVAAHAITIAILSNTIVKTGMVVTIGHPSIRRRTLLATAAIVAAGVAAIVLV